jgi:hypothetical protein
MDTALCIPSAEQDSPPQLLPVALEDRIRERTWDRVRDLCVKADPGGVLVRGRTRTYYIKQLAIQAVREVLGPADATPISAEIEVI